MVSSLGFTGYHSWNLLDVILENSMDVIDQHLDTLYRDWLTFGNENLEEWFLLSAKEGAHSSLLKSGAKGDSLCTRGNAHRRKVNMKSHKTMKKTI